MTQSIARKSLEPILKDDVTYYAHQVAGIRSGYRLRNFLLADDMGLGKSLQALTIFCMDAKQGLAETLLIVCPTTLRENWADEIEKFTRLPYVLLGEEPHPTLKGRVRKLSPAQRDKQLQAFMEGSGPRVLITNYEQISSPTHTDTLAFAEFDAVVFDEAHYIKNHKSKRTKAALGIRSTRTLLLTGTPMLNQVDELWPLLHKINPTKFPSYWKFRNRYCIEGGFQGRQVIGTKNSAELVGYLSEVMIRRLKKDVLTLPQPYYITTKIKLSELQQKLYDEAKEDLIVGDLDISNAMVLFLRLKQICNTPRSIGEAFPDESNKLDRLEEIVEEITGGGTRKDPVGEKLVIFTQFRGTLACIMRRLQEKFPKLPAFELHGDIPTTERIPTVKLWSSTQGPAVIACMLQVAGVGLNMTAASTCVFVDKLFVPGLNAQAVDRLHRIGASETQAVRVIELIAKGTCEDRIEQILRSKLKLNEEIVEGSVSMKKILEELVEMEKS